MDIRKETSPETVVLQEEEEIILIEINTSLLCLLVKRNERMGEMNENREREKNERI
jgi:hypothetical protein